MSGSTVTYLKAVGGRDLVEEFLTNGVEETVQLSSSAQGAGYATTFTVPAGVSAATVGQGVEFRDAKGTLVGSFGSGVAFDAAGAQAPVTAAVSAVNGRSVSVQVGASPSWVADARRVFPLALDPVYTWTTSSGGSADTSIESGTNAGTNYNGASYMSVGYGVSGTNVDRGLVQISVGSLVATNMTVQSANFSMVNFSNSGSSCAPTTLQVFALTAGFNTGTTWNNVPPAEATASATTALGTSPCPAGQVNFDVTGLVRRWVVAPVAFSNFGMLIRGTESSAGGWRRFRTGEAGTNMPTLTITYDRRPNVPTSRATTPTTPCVQGGSRPFINTLTPTLTAAVVDVDSIDSRAKMEVWPTGGSGAIASGSTPSGRPGTAQSWTVPGGGVLANGSTYSWRAQGDDGTATSLSWAPFCEFTVDTTFPATPSVWSNTYPVNSWVGSNAPATFTFSSTGYSDVATWAYRFDTGSFVNTPGSFAANSSTNVTISPPAGWQNLRVIAIDRAGNRSGETVYSFGSKTAMLTPADGTVTPASVPLSAVTSTAANQVWYAYRLSDTDSWQNVPASAITYPGGGNPPVPVATTTSGVSSYSPALNLNLSTLLGGVDASVQLKADFSSDGSYLWSSDAATVSLDRNAFGSAFATDQVGPGTVSLLTGNYALSATDASVQSYGSDLTVSRTFNSKNPTATGMFGPGWVSSLAVDAAGSDYTGLSDLGSSVKITSSDGSLLIFNRKTAGYVGQGGAQGLILRSSGTVTNGPASFLLTDPEANTTTFTSSVGFGTAPSLTTPHSYPVTSVTQPGVGQSTSYSYDGSGRLVRAQAPAPPGVTCPAWPSTFGGPSQMGCRALDLQYTGTVVTSIHEQTTDGSGTGIDISLACFAYDGNGRLAQAWDPRNTATSCAATPAAGQLATSYSYDGSGRVLTLTPPGLAAWNFTWTGNGSLGQLYRTHNATWGGGSETWTVEYNVPIGNDANASSGLHPDLSGGTAATWAQTDLPTTATAVYSPGDTLGSTAGDYRDAVIHALDVNGREVNTATYSGSGQAGWKVSTTEYDDSGNIIRTLDPANRDRALRRTDAPTTTVDLPSDTAAAARMLDTTYLYALNPYDTSVETGTVRDLTDTFGPMHLTVIPDPTGALPQGVTVAARAHTHTTYDTGAETGHPAPTTVSLHLPIASYTEASQNPGVYTGTATAPSGTDARTTTLSYTIGGAADTTGWTFRTPLQSTVTPGGTAAPITSTTRLDPTTGQVLKRSQPSDTAGTGVGTTQTTYYSAGATNNGACVNNAWYMQVCRTNPASQISPRPSGMPDLPATYSVYDYLLRPSTVQQTVTDANGTTQVRSTTTTWENSGWSPRPVSVATSNSISSGSQILPAITTTYDPNTGLPLTQSASGEGSALTSAYDDFGRPVSFTDADNAQTTTSYDGLGRVASSSEIYGGVTLRTTTLGYNGNTPSGVEHRGLVTSSTTTGLGGAFTAVYDAGGSLLSQTYPTGITAAYRTDETSDTTAVTYSKNGTTWFADTQRSNIHGQWRTHDGLPSSQTYTYDGAGRLTETRDSSGTSSSSDYSCLTRQYAFDVNSNRTSLTSYPDNGTDRSCQTSTGASTVSLAYDAADRLTSSGRAAGITYDAFGRTTTLPAALTTVSGNGGTTVTSSYYANDLVLNQAAGTLSRSWQLDATQQRFRTATDNTTGTTITKTLHYAGLGGDSPNWIDEGNGLQTRYTSDLSGNLAATDMRNTSNGTLSGPTWNLNNLHGDLVATATNNATTTYDGPIVDTDEYGNQKTANSSRYGWLGSKQRSTETLGGLTLMGVRLYSPVAGRFLQTDPIPGGSANNYDYANQDPINNYDLDGRCFRFGFFRIHCAKGGKNNIRDSGLRDKSDDEIRAGARDSTNPERKRYQKEEKARGLRHSGGGGTSNFWGRFGGGAAGGGLLWWLGKGASPLCGPAMPACAIAF